LAQSWNPCIRPSLSPFGISWCTSRSGGHPLDVTRADDAAVAQAVAVLDVTVKDVGDGLDAPVGVPGEPRQVLLRPVRAEVVEQQERIAQVRILEAQGASEVHPRALDGRPGTDDLPDLAALWHRAPPLGVTGG
jgi:hypothetical protein